MEFKGAESLRGEMVECGDLEWLTSAWRGIPAPAFQSTNVPKTSKDKALQNERGAVEECVSVMVVLLKDMFALYSTLEVMINFAFTRVSIQ